MYSPNLIVKDFTMIDKGRNKAEIKVRDDIFFVTEKTKVN